MDHHRLGLLVFIGMATKTKKRAVLTTVTKPPKDTYIGGTPTGKADMGKRLQSAIASIEDREGTFIEGDKGHVRKPKSKPKTGVPAPQAKHKPKPKSKLKTAPRKVYKNVHIKAHTRRVLVRER